MKYKKIVITLLLILIAVSLVTYVINDIKHITPSERLEKLNKLDAELVYELKNENWYAKVVVDQDIEKYTNTSNGIREYYHLEYIGDKEIFKENLPFEYKIRSHVGCVSDKRFLDSTVITQCSAGGYGITSYPDKLTLEINLDGEIEIFYLTKQ